MSDEFRTGKEPTFRWEPVSNRSRSLPPLLLGGLMIGSLALLSRLTHDLMDGDGQSEHGSMRFDGEAMQEVRRQGPPRWLSRTLEAAGKVSSTKTLGPISLLLTLVLIKNHRKSAAFLAANILSTLALQRSAKAIVGRPRPQEQRGKSASSSFPSGHSTLSTSLALALTLVARREFPHYQNLAAAILLPLATLIGASRPLIRQHFPSDVLAGHALGAAATLGLGLWYARDTDREITVRGRHRSELPTEPQGEDRTRTA